ncbi:MAG TPA: hypothetical protein VN843_24675 [Anaerolineales bacterium]|nr:hypothetical protein [Anaerolineales bacterium]
MKFRKKTVNFPVLGHYRIHVIVASDVKKYMAQSKLFNHVSMDGENSDTTAITLHRMGESTIILPLSATAGTVAHEAYHAVRKRLVKQDIELDNEIVAYHLGYLVNKISLLLKEK